MPGVATLSFAGVKPRSNAWTAIAPPAAIAGAAAASTVAELVPWPIIAMPLPLGAAVEAAAGNGVAFGIPFGASRGVAAHPASRPIARATGRMR